MTEEYKRKLFLNRQFEANTFQVGKVRLNSSIRDLDRNEIIDVFVDQKGYENLNFSDRIESLKTTSGWVHYASGASFKIDQGVVRQIKLSTKYLQDNKINKADLLGIFGQPDTELIDDICYSALDYNIDAHILVYRKRQIYAFVDPQTEILKELHFGTLDEKIYGNKNKPNSNLTLAKAKRSWWQKLFGN
ncbi:MAG: hypothetical protein IPP64_17175 [Bacteroidetes bacterium]|nr:hypothetical protein [Bacteroidota bacterium]